MKARRRIGVMLSSTFADLEEKRKKIVELMRRHEMFDIAMEGDAALPTLDKIASSLRKVEMAEAYVCVIGHRYGSRESCPNRNSDNLSLTELEWRYAKERGIPRCTLIMSPKYSGLSLAEVEAISAEDRESLIAFRKLAESDMVYASFDNDADFEVKAMQSLEHLRHDLDLLGVSNNPPSPSSNAPKADKRVPTAPPAFHFVRKPYVEKRHFVGRVNELAQIDSWATSQDSMLLFQGIGGMGKSMLTWHWVKNRATHVRNDWAGRLWYSFYEQGADLNDFCVHALAYMRHVSPALFRGIGTSDLAHELRRELDERPWLLVLDGLERVLVAYNRSGKEHMPDEEAEVVQDALGLEREPRSCFRPEDDDVLATLAQVDHGKLLASSRLMPTALTSTPLESIPGVTRIELEGLAPADAETVLRNAKIRGDGWRIQRFLKEQFACHPLTVGVVAGEVAEFLDARGNFDIWIDHPKGGADPSMLAKGLRGRQNHILERAFHGLDDDEKNLLGAIAMANIDLPMELVRIINPKRPLPPEEMTKPERQTDDDLYYGSNNLEFDKTYREWRDENTPEEDKLRTRMLLDYLIEKDLIERTAAYERRILEISQYAEVTKDANQWMMGALRKFESRGLLQFHASTGAIDMHPAIRHTAINGLSSEAKSNTGSHVSDALSSRPQQPFENARALGDLALPIASVKALIIAEKFDAAFEFLDRIENVLVRLEREDILAELTHPFFPDGWYANPRELSIEKTRLLRVAMRAIPWGERDRYSISERLLLLDISNDDAIHVCTTLCTFYPTEEKEAFHVRRWRLLSLAMRLAEAVDINALKRRCLLYLAQYHLQAANLTAMESCLQPCRSAIKSSELASGLIGNFWALEIDLSYRTGNLTSRQIDDALQQVRKAGSVSNERSILQTRAEWLTDREMHPEALTAYGDVIALANSTAARGTVPFYRASRVVSLVALGRIDEARAIAADYESHFKGFSSLSATNFLALGETEKARDHALGSYPEYWGDGPPYHFHWELEECRRVLAAVGTAEPDLPYVDPASVEPFDFEADIERLIEGELAKTAERQARATRRAEEAANAADPAHQPADDGVSEP